MKSSLKNDLRRFFCTIGLGTAMIAAPKLMEGDAHVYGHRALMKEILSWVWGYPCGVLLVLFALYVCKDIYNGFMSKNDDVPELVVRVSADDESAEVWRQGGTLVLGRNQDLPSRCVHCNIEVSTRPTEHLFSVIDGDEVPEATVHAYYCKEHSALRICLNNWGLRIVALGVPLFIFGFFSRQNVAKGDLDGLGSCFGGILIMLFGACIAWRQRKGLEAVKISEKYSYIKGCSEKFLDSLPQFNSRSD